MNSGPEEQVTNAKRIVFITYSEHGTLGDPSSAIKLMKCLKEKYGNACTMILLVEIESFYVPKLKKIVPDNIHCVPWVDKMMEFSNPHKPKFNAALRQADAFVIYPTPHGLDDSQMQDLLDIGVPVIAATEYDISLSIYGSKLSIVRKPGVYYFGTGFGNNMYGQASLGIFMTNEDPQRGDHWLSQITEDIFIRDFLLETSSEEDMRLKEEIYFATHSLFYGYFNNLNGQSPDCAITPSRFVILCILKALKNFNDTQRIAGHTIDILLPLQDRTKGDTCFTNADDVIADLLSSFGNELIKIEYYCKNNEGKLDLFKTQGNGAVVIRLINGTPFAPSTVDKFLKASDPLCMMTGDQSFTEALSNKKTILYQIMLWKIDFFNAFINTVDKHLGQESVLYKLLILQKQNSDTHFDVPQYMKYILEQETFLQHEMNILAYHLLNNHNLGTNFSNVIMHIIEENRLIKSMESYVEPKLTRPAILTSMKGQYQSQEPIPTQEAKQEELVSRKRDRSPPCEKKDKKDKKEKKEKGEAKKTPKPPMVYKKPRN